MIYEVRGSNFLNLFFRFFNRRINILMLKSKYSYVYGYLLRKYSKIKL